MEFVLSNDLILEKIFGYLPYQDIVEAGRVCQKWCSIVGNILIKTHYPLIGINVIDYFTPENFIPECFAPRYPTDIRALLWNQDSTKVFKKVLTTSQSPASFYQRIFGKSIYPSSIPSFLLIFGCEDKFYLDECDTVVVGSDCRIFCDQISTQDMNSFYGDSNLTYELMACLLLPQLYSDLQVTVSVWVTGNSLYGSEEYPPEPAKGILVFYDHKSDLKEGYSLHRFVGKNANIKDKILINGPAGIQYYREGHQEDVTVLSVTFSGERVKVAMFSHEFSDNDEISFREKLTEFKESLEFETESDMRDQFTLGLVFMHGNPSFDPRCYLKSLFSKVAFIESTQERWPGTSYIYSELIDKVREDSPSCSSSESATIFNRFDYAKYPIGKISIVLINLKR